MEVTVFDPDHDPEGTYAAELSDTLVAGLAALRPAGAPAIPRPRSPVSPESADHP
jgi:arginase